MNRNANDGVTYNKQVDMLPLFGGSETKAGDFKKLIAEYLNVKVEDIYGSDLYLYNRMQPSVWGAHEEFISSPQLDDLQCAYTSLQGFLKGNNEKSINVIACFDNEEVGSGTKQGAGSTFLYDTLYRLNKSLGKTDEDFYRTLALGISGSGSGVAMLILPVLLTSVIENKDMYAAFRLDALLMAITAVLLYLTIRESPEEAGLMPWGYEEENEKRKVVNEGAGLTSGEYAMLLVSMLFMGISTQPEVNHISVYFHELSFDPMLAPRTISVIGFFLIIGKCVYGYLVDIFQAFYVNLVYFLGIIAGLFFLVN